VSEQIFPKITNFQVRIRTTEPNTKAR